MKSAILVIDDERDVLELVTYNLKQAGFEVVTARDGEEGLSKARAMRPNLILLDVMLPQLDGMELCKIFRSTPATAGVPIIMLTAKAAEIDRVLGLELGADDYVTKPFSPRELVLRVKKLLERRRPSATSGEVYKFGILTVDVPRHTVLIAAKKVELTSTEFKLLKVLIEGRGFVQSRERLLREVWEYEKFIDTRTVDTHMRRLRDKLGPAAEYLQTTRGVGYRFASE
jgi:two-component system phosphate regulon response regulator PhoB